MKCFRCGADIPDMTRFCGHCGTLVQDPQAGTLIVEGMTPEGELERLRMVLHGEFEVEREIARGGMGVVYEARDVQLDRRVALKVLAFDKALTVRSAERFKREARMVADLEHPNIVPVYRVGDRGGVLFIAMKFVQGRSLDAIVAEQGALPLAVALHLLRGATRALTWAHERGIVHRDVKGGNLLIDHDGRVLVSDFGVALRASDITLTMDGALIGTPAFMSPEQCAGKRAGPQSDQYSLGIVGFEVLTGVVPFTSDTLPGFIQHHLHSTVPDLRLARDDLPAPLIAVVQRTLEKDPDRRFPTTREMLNAIEAIPFAENDRRVSEEMLARLAQGADVPRVSTRSLPALADAATLIVARPRPPWSRTARWSAATAGLLGLAGVALVLASPRNGATGAARPAADSAPPPTAEPLSRPAAAAESAPTPAPPAPPTPGALRVLANPASAEILVDGRVVSVGSAVDLKLTAGSRRIGLRAQGYESFDTSLTVAPGALVNLGRVVLRPRSSGS